MTLRIGSRLGAYEIVAAIGSGGMGEVYRARDTKLERDVALKVLPELFTADADRLVRFEREAKVLASLNHPNIAAIYELEEADSVRALVLELVEGPTLADRIAEGPVPVNEALPIAKQIAEAVEAAHEHGIVHRDLKPANIKVRDDRTVKVLDFGLARALQEEVAAADVSQSPTLSVHATRMGVILGTAAYMSPEQARGKMVDKRADIWAFGAVLYEMLTGTRPFPGDDVTDVLVAVLSKDPDWTRLPPGTPTTIRQLLSRCLEKDCRRRLRDIGDALLELDALLQPAEAASPLYRTEPRMWQRPVRAALGLLAAICLTGVMVWGLTRPAPLASLPVSRFPLPLPLDVQGIHRDPTLALAVSPDGATMVFLGAAGSEQRLFRRPMDQLRAVPIPGTENGHAPFFSADGQSIGFEADGMLKKVPLAGGSALTICRIPGGRLDGASWTSDGTIVFAGTRTGLFRVSAGGGEPRALTTPVQKDGEVHRRPEVLPEGRAALFNASGRIEVVLLDTGERRPLLQGTNPHFATSGHLVFARQNSVWAAPFDPVRLQLTGEPVLVLEGVENFGGAQFALSGNGTLTYIPALTIRGDATRDATLVVVDRTGRVSPLPYEQGRYQVPRLSPNGRRLAVRRETDIWVLEVDRVARTRLTRSNDDVAIPSAWTPDGTRITYSGRSARQLFTIRADSSREPELLFEGQRAMIPMSWSRDGVLAFYTSAPETGLDIWVVSANGSPQPTPVIATPSAERAARFSPDGRWLAFVSDESGRDEVYVWPYPGPGAKVPISTVGGTEPVWSPSGRELFYRNGRQMVAVALQTQPAMVVSNPSVLFEEEGYVLDGQGNANYDIFPDGQRFVMVRRAETFEGPTIVVVLNWFEELKRLVPTH